MLGLQDLTLTQPSPPLTAYRVCPQDKPSQVAWQPWSAAAAQVRPRSAAWPGQQASGPHLTKRRPRAALLAGSRVDCVLSCIDIQHTSQPTSDTSNAIITHPPPPLPCQFSPVLRMGAMPARLADAKLPPAANQQAATSGCCATASAKVGSPWSPSWPCCAAAAALPAAASAAGMPDVQPAACTISPSWAETASARSGPPASVKAAAMASPAVFMSELEDRKG